MTLKTKTLIKIASLIIFLILFIYFILTHLKDFSSLSLVSPSTILILIVLFILSYFFIGLINRTVLVALKVPLKIKESFALSLMTGFYNVISPFKGGMALRAIYLKKHYNFTYTDFIISLTAIGILSFFITSIAGIITTIIIYNTTGRFSISIFLIFLVTACTTLILMSISPKGKHHLFSKWRTITHHWSLIKTKKQAIFQVALFTTLALLNSAFMMHLQFYSLGSNLSYIKALFLVSLSSLSIIINITPAGLGIQEAITVFSGLALGISPVYSLAAALLGRAVSFTVLFILGPICSYYLLKNTNRKI